MWNRVKDLFRQTIMQVLVTGVIVVIAFIFSQIAALPAYQILVVIIVVIGFTFWGLNQITIFHENHKKKNLEKYILDTMLKLGLSIQKKNTANNPNALFNIHLAHNNEHYNIIRDKSNPNDLILVSVTNIAEKDWGTFDRITGNSTSTLLQDLQIELARLGVSCEGFTHPLRTFSIMNIIPCIHIQEDDLVNGIELVRRAKAITGAVIAKEIRKFGSLTSPEKLE